MTRGAEHRDHRSTQATDPDRTIRPRPADVSGHMAGHGGHGRSRVATDPGGDRAGPVAASGGSVRVFESLASSPNLRMRHLEMLPLRGPSAVFTTTQGRSPGETTSPEGLADLISSISVVGLVQPVLVEEFTDPADPTAPAGPRRASAPRARRLRLVSGERRLRAMRWGAVNDPDNEQFAAIPAVVCPGPLTDAERRCWQLVENIAREDLRPGELAAALLLERCAIAEAKLAAHQRPIPAEVAELEDPVQRWQALERLRGSDVDCAAPWSEVLQRLGLQLSQRKARQLVAAFALLPRHISAEMDQEKVALHTRITFARLHRGRSAAAEEIWGAVRDRHRPDLLAAASRAGLEHPDTTAARAIDHAQTLHERANAARAEKLGKQSESEHPPTSSIAAVGDLLNAARSLANALRNGRRPAAYDTGSLRLLLTEILQLLDQPEAGTEPVADHFADPDTAAETTTVPT